MKLHLLEAHIQKYFALQVDKDDTAWYFPHQIVNRFHLTWNSSEHFSLRERYEGALWSGISQRWWKGDHYRPKEIMLKLIDADPELALIAFKDLSNESASLDGRLYRFNYYAEELLQIHRKNNPGDIETHHHQDAGIISLYLSGMIPEKYTLYPGLNSFQTFCRSMGSPDIPVVDDLLRYMKVAAIVFTFCSKNPLFEKLNEKRSGISHNIQFLPFQLSYEIISFADNKG